VLQGAVGAGRSWPGLVGSLLTSVRSSSRHGPVTLPFRRLVHLLAAGASGQAHSADEDAMEAYAENGQDLCARLAVKESSTSPGQDLPGVCASPSILSKQVPTDNSRFFLSDMNKDARRSRIGACVWWSPHGRGVR
jgi:hypothetical protein